jgi:hypothetical protein
MFIRLLGFLLLGIMCFSFHSQSQSTIRTFSKTYKIKETFLFDDSLLSHEGIIFFLNISNSNDSLTWVNAVNGFLNSSKLIGLNDFHIYNLFYRQNGPNLCNNCGVFFRHKTDTVIISTPSCLLFGCKPELIQRSLKKLDGFKYSARDSFNNKMGFVEYEVPQGICNIQSKDAQLSAWAPFLEEVFFPAYTLAEQVEILQIEFKKLSDIYKKLNDNYEEQAKKLKEAEIRLDEIEKHTGMKEKSAPEQGENNNSVRRKKQTDESNPIQCDPMPNEKQENNDLKK